MNISAIGGLLLAITYGTKVKQQIDSRVIVAEQVADYISESLSSISILIDAMPYLVPLISPFLPTAAFSKSKTEWSDMVSRFRDDPFVHVQTLMVSFFPSNKLLSWLVIPFPFRRTGWLRTLWYRVL